MELPVRWGPKLEVCAVFVFLPCGGKTSRDLPSDLGLELSYFAYFLFSVSGMTALGLISSREEISLVFNFLKLFFCCVLEGKYTVFM